MTVWIIEPQDPLLMRDGRPFGPTPGARARSLPFPFPSTTTGAARTRLGQEPDGRFPAERAASVQGIAVRGPLLVDLSGGTPLFLAPAPADALLFDAPGGGLSLRRLAPLARPAGAASDHDDELGFPVGLPHRDTRKPAHRPPAFWRWDAFQRWLLDPADDEVVPEVLGLPPLPLDRRMHVGIDPATLTGRDGALFMTAGLTFWHNTRPEELCLSAAHRLGLAVDVADVADVADGAGLSLDAGFGPLGGERRLVYWRPAGAPLPPIPNDLAGRLVADGHCRVVLLTPAAFDAGYAPHFLTKARAGVTATVMAAAVGKPQTVSGWDLVAKGPRGSRRLAPAGSVFYLKLTGSDAAIGRWLDEIWLSNVSDLAADRDAGFGLAAVGAWSGVPETITMEEA